jgi:membrane protein implicated in regulation of membrane protease activity
MRPTLELTAANGSHSSVIGPVFLLIAVVLLLFVPWPWGLVAFAVGLICFLGEIAFWHRRVRGKPKAVGAQRMIGEKATVVTACRPNGQVRVGGEIWAARCDEGADVDDEVTIVGRKQLVLVVTPG